MGWRRPRNAGHRWPTSRCTGKGIVYVLKAMAHALLMQELLSRTGRFYLVGVKANDIPSIQSRMSEVHALESEVCPSFSLSERDSTIILQIVLQRRAGREHLFVVRFCRQQASVPT